MSHAPPPPKQQQQQQGRNVSGRPWKAVEVTRGTMKGVSTPWEKRMKARDELKRLRDAEADLLEGRKARIVAQKERREAKKAQAQKNEFNSSTYQVINNEKTMKNLSKKQLRQIKRTRVSQQGHVELVDAYAPIYDKNPSQPPSKKVRRR